MHRLHYNLLLECKTQSKFCSLKQVNCTPNPSCRAWGLCFNPRRPQSSMLHHARSAGSCWGACITQEDSRASPGRHRHTAARQQTPKCPHITPHLPRHFTNCQPVAAAGRFRPLSCHAGAIITASSSRAGPGTKAAAEQEILTSNRSTNGQRTAVSQVSRACSPWWEEAYCVLSGVKGFSLVGGERHAVC
jgi:hypothetical protein